MADCSNTPQLRNSTNYLTLLHCWAQPCSCQHAATGPAAPTTPRYIQYLTLLRTLPYKTYTCFAPLLRHAHTTYNQTPPTINTSEYYVLHCYRGSLSPPKTPTPLAPLHLQLHLQLPPRSVLSFNSTRLDAASDIDRIMSPTEGRTAFLHLLHASRSQ
jgi:hypothetical protein